MADYTAIATAIEAAVKAEIAAALVPITNRMDIQASTIVALDARVDALEGGTVPGPGPGPEPEPPPTGGFPKVVNPLAWEPMVSAPQPAYLAAHSCQHQSGTTRIFRVSNTAGVRHNYSSLSAFNRDGSLVMLVGTTPRILRGDDYRELNANASGLGLGWFSGSDPHLAFGLTGSRTLREVSVSATGQTAITTTHAPSGYSSVNFGGGQGMGSVDDRWHSFFWTKTNGDYGVAVYDRQTKTVTYERKVGTGSQRIDNCGMSWSGEWLQYNISDDGSGSGTTPDKGMWIGRRDGSGWFQAAQKQEHWDWAAFKDRRDAFCYWTSAGIRVVDPQTHINVNAGNSSSGNTHFSGRCFDLPGWGLVSRADIGGNAPGSNQVYLTALDGSKDAMVLGFQHRTTDPGYSSDSMGCVSADGRRAIIGSPWEGGSTYAYVLGV